MDPTHAPGPVAAPSVRQSALAMDAAEFRALGHALVDRLATFLETLPPFEDGPGNGQWNLGDYIVARASDLPLDKLEIEVLPPVSPKEPPKGMAEVIMIPIVPALLNAINDAIGHRFQSLPVTPGMVKKVLS
mgnify:CR=1 FL=1